MTAQISNDIKYNGEVYELLYESNYIFEPEKFGFYKTYWNCSAPAVMSQPGCFTFLQTEDEAFGGQAADR